MTEKMADSDSESCMAARGSGVRWAHPRTSGMYLYVRTKNRRETYGQ